MGFCGNQQRPISEKVLKMQNYFEKYTCEIISTYLNELTHWGRVTHICVGKLTIIDSDNGLSPGQHQAIIWTNAEILLIGPLDTNFNDILIGIQTFSFKEMHLKMSSAKWRPFCLGLNVLSASCEKWEAWGHRRSALRIFCVTGNEDDSDRSCAHQSQKLTFCYSLWIYSCSHEIQ